MGYFGELLLEVEFDGTDNEFCIHSGKHVDIHGIQSEDEELRYETIRYEQIRIYLLSQRTGRVLIKIKFYVKFNIVPYGCYVCHNAGDHMISTVFSPTYARWAYPCFDEPHFRAVFKLQIQTTLELIPISNCAIVNSTIVDGLKTYEFDESPRMCSYITHWTLTTLKSISSTASDGTLISIYSKSPEYSSEDLALAIDAFEYFREYLTVEYPLPKLDLIQCYGKS